MTAIATVFLPLIGAVLAGMLAFVPARDKDAQARINTWANWLTCGALLLSAVFGVWLFYDVAVQGNPGRLNCLPGSIPGRWIFPGRSRWTSLPPL